MSIKSLQKKLTKISREYIFLRDKNICQWCGRSVEKQNGHLSHVIPKSRGNYLRWDENNLMVLCFHCHINRWHKNPLEAAEWFKNKFPDRWAYLEKNKNKIAKFKEKWYQDKIKYYQNKIKETLS